MGDGSVVGCSGKGTRYVKRFGDSMSPTCGYRYDRQGSYGVTAVSDWVVRWAGEGARGTFTIQLQSSTRVVVGELQVTTVDGRK